MVGRALNRFPWDPGELPPQGGWLHRLRAGGRRPGAPEERNDAVHRRCRSGDAWPQPGDPAAAWIRWVGVGPAGMECGGGTASPHCP